MEKEQTEGFDLLKGSEKKLRQDLNDTQLSMKVNIERTDKMLSKNKSNIENKLLKIQNVYIKNQSTYHSNNKKLYKIVSQTSAQEYEEIDKLIREFESLD